MIERDLERAEREKREAKRAELEEIAEKVRNRERLKAQVIELFEASDSDVSPVTPPEAKDEAKSELACEESDYDVCDEIFGVKREEIDRDLFEVGYPLDEKSKDEGASSSKDLDASTKEEVPEEKSDREVAAERAARVFAKCRAAGTRNEERSRSRLRRQYSDSASSSGSRRP